MKPLPQPTHDAEALQQLGRAAVQIVHDLKNQLNGLKLYATFLRKRAEQAGRPTDELETVNKIIAGLERAAADTATLVRFGRTLELRRQPADLAKILSSVEGEAAAVPPGQSFRGEFDAAALADALRILGAEARGGREPGQQKVLLTREEAGGGPSALVDWPGAAAGRLLEAADTFSGGAGLRVALAAKIIGAHGGALERQGDTLRARLPLSK
jgi:hypothetical protein